MFLLHGFGVPVIASIVDTVLPLFSISYPPISAISIAVSSLFIGYGIWKHNLFTLTPMAAAENIVAAMNDALVLVDKNTRILSANDAVQRLLGFHGMELVGQPVEKIFDDDVPPWLIDAMESHNQRKA